jgi:hypothetical protein
MVDGDDVAAVMVPLGSTSTPPTLGPFASAFLVLDVSLAPAARLPRRLVHELTLTLEPDVPELPHVIRTGATDVVRDRPVVIDPPLAGDRWMALNGCCTLTGHRGAITPVNGAFMVAQRFAIDIAQLDAEGRLFTGPPDALSSYPYYGAEVRSVADGVVVRTLDGIPDNPPGTVPPIDPTLRTVPGNHVVVDIGDGRFAGYAHFQPGSLTVEVGDRVRRGDVLGLLGNSGNSDLPHLHFQVTNGPGFLGADGLPYVVRAFDSEGILVNGEEVLGGGMAVIDPSESGRHTRQLPLDLRVIGFPERDR